MPYIVYLTEKVTKEDYNGRDYYDYETDVYTGDTPLELMERIAQAVWWILNKHESPSYELSPMFHTDTGTPLTLDVLQQTDAWKKCDAEEAIVKEKTEAARLAMLQMSEVHKEALDRAEYERLKAKYEGVSE
jgi:hypothetical protein